MKPLPLRMNAKIRTRVPKVIDRERGSTVDPFGMRNNSDIESLLVKMIIDERWRDTGDYV